ncbi:MAG: protein kinase [Planctomycetes bacterium]|nr:protein kinase [Planctomycetota bacterium]
MGDDPLLGWTTDSLRFEQLLGRGGMGAVYRGQQVRLGRTVAIKVVAPHLAADLAYIERFAREARTLGQLVHQHVIACHDFGPIPGPPPSHDQLFVMVLEFVDGWSLGSLLRTRRLAVRQVLELHRQAAEGLAAAHKLGIIHRDIKPDNIMVTRNGVAKLADFGLARKADSVQLTQTGALLGSPAYMAPESCRGEEPESPADVYSLGCSLFQCLTGRTPFDGQSTLQVIHQHINVPAPALSALRTDLAVADETIAGCLAKDAAQRPSAADLARVLRALIAEIPPEVQAGPGVSGTVRTAAAAAPTQLSGQVTMPGKPAGAGATVATALPRGRGHQRGRPAPAPAKPSTRRWLLVAGAAVLALGGLAAVALATAGRRPAPGQSQPPAPTASAASQRQPPATEAAAAAAPATVAADRPRRLTTLISRDAPAADLRRLPGYAPAVPGPFQASVDQDGMHILRLDPPPQAGTGDQGGAVLLLGSDRGPQLAIAAEVDGKAQTLLSLALPDGDWDAYSIPLRLLPPRTTALRLSAETPFYLAGAIAANRQPPRPSEWPFTPGTLLPWKAEGVSQLGGYRQFDFQFRARLLWPAACEPRHPGTGAALGRLVDQALGLNGPARTRVDLWETGVGGEGLKKALSEDGQPTLELIYLPTLDGPTPQTVMGLKLVLLERVRNGSLPVVLLGAEAAGSGESYDKWRKAARLLSQPLAQNPERAERAELRGRADGIHLPVIELGVVPTFYHRHGEALERDGEEWKKRLGLGLEAGLRQLKARLLAAQARRPDAGQPPR